MQNLDVASAELIAHARTHEPCRYISFIALRLACPSLPTKVVMRGLDPGITAVSRRLHTPCAPGITPPGRQRSRSPSSTCRARGRGSSPPEPTTRSFEPED